MDGKFTKSTTYFGFKEFRHRVITIHQQYTFPLLFPNQCTRSFPFPLCVDLIHNCHQLWPFPKTCPGSSSIINGTSSYPGPSTLPSGASSYRRSSDFLPSVSFYPVASSPMALPIQDSLSGPLSYPGSSSILFGYPSPVKSMSKSTSRPPRVPNPYMCPANPSPLKSVSKSTSRPSRVLNPCVCPANQAASSPVVPCALPAPPFPPQVLEHLAREPNQALKLQVAWPGWLEPLLDRIARDPTNVVCPVINSLRDDTLEFHYHEDPSKISVGGFRWNMIVSWAWRRAQAWWQMMVKEQGELGISLLV